MTRPFSDSVVRSSNRTPVEVSPGVQRRTLVWGENAMLAQWRMKAGTVITPDQNSEMEQVAYVAAGQVEVHMEGQSAVLKSGSAFLAPFRAQPTITALEDTTFIAMFSPPQEEWKP